MLTKRRSKKLLFGLSIFALALVVVALPAFANIVSSSTFHSWEGGSWTVGSNIDYDQGEVSPIRFVAHIEAPVQTPETALFCLDAASAPFSALTQWAFSALEPYDTTVTPTDMENPAGRTTDTLDGFYVVDGTIDSVDALGIEGGTCNADELAYQIDFTPANIAPTSVYIYFGARLAAPGDLVDTDGDGTGDEVVTVGPTTSGTIQVTWAPASKTLNHKSAGNAVTISGFVWEDVNNSADYVTDGDSGFAGVTVYLCPIGITPPNAACLSTITDGNGNYAFVSPGDGGSYYVVVDGATLPLGGIATWNSSTGGNIPNPWQNNDQDDGIPGGGGLAISQSFTAPAATNRGDIDLGAS